jgi:predicted oxidoreductase
MDNKIMKWHETNNNQFDEIQERLTKVFKYFSDSKNQRDFGVSDFKTRMLDLLDQQADARRSSENNLLSLLDDKTGKLRTEIANESKARFTRYFNGGYLKYRANQVG